MNWVENMKILLVDDDEFSMKLAKTYLDNMWFDTENIVMTDDLLRAIELAKKDIFDIILMDIRIRWPRGGVLATQQIRKNLNWSSPKIISYSADIFAIQETEIKKLFDWSITKPVNIENFKENILKILNIQTE
jgi:CheY-like chemotaxis protein